MARPTKYKGPQKANFEPPVTSTILGPILEYHQSMFFPYCF